MANETAITLTFPFDARLSKNQRLQYGNGKIYRRKDVQQLENSFITYATAYLKPLINAAKLNVKLIVYRPSLRIDAQNFIDVFCDIIQQATGINDRNFINISCVSELDRGNPRFILEVSDAST